jgi:hypothetical protein
MKASRRRERRTANRELRTAYGETANGETANCELRTANW